MTDRNFPDPPRFAALRSQPSIDLACRIRPLKKPYKILDIGCGTGNSTHVLAQAFPHACIIGIDSSENMIQVAKNSSIDLDADLDFMICDATTGLPSLENNYDIVFSNDTIGWIPRHEELLKNMMERLRPGGIMAVQTPRWEKHPLSRAIRAVIGSEKYKGVFAKNLWRKNNLAPEQYAAVLDGIAEKFDIWETTYYHRLKSYHDTIEWLHNTRLRTFFSTLSPQKTAEFEADLLEAFSHTLPATKDGDILMPFPRLFFTAMR